jgi:hypothetical protein
MTLTTWLFRLLTWDGILPICILLIPSLVEWLNPNGNVNGIIYVAIAIAAFFIRAEVGGRHIESNNCSETVRRIQAGLFFLAIFILAFLDAFVMAVPVGALGQEDYAILAILLAVYFTLMALAMYPGGPKDLPEVIPFDKSGL